MGTSWPVEGMDTAFLLISLHMMYIILKHFCALDKAVSIPPSQYTFQI